MSKVQGHISVHPKPIILQFMQSLVVATLNVIQYHSRMADVATYTKQHLHLSSFLLGFTFNVRFVPSTEIICKHVETSLGLQTQCCMQRHM